jgi:hypothetical protein
MAYKTNDAVWAELWSATPPKGGWTELTRAARQEAIDRYNPTLIADVSGYRGLRKLNEACAVINKPPFLMREMREQALAMYQRTYQTADRKHFLRSKRVAYMLPIGPLETILAAGVWVKEALTTNKEIL